MAPLGGRGRNSQRMWKKRWKNGSFRVELLLCVLLRIRMDRMFIHFSKSIYFKTSFLHVSQWISSVESKPMVGNAFTNSCPDWKDGTYEIFKDWAVRQFGVKELESDDEAEVPVHMQKAKDIAFKRSKKTGYILPSMSNFRTTRQKQRVIRGFIGAVYSMRFN